VLSATAWGRDASEARALALEGLERVDYAGKVLRRDIGAGP
jgi:phosphoribosylamine-glycine ligase